MFIVVLDGAGGGVEDAKTMVISSWGNDAVVVATVWGEGGVNDDCVRDMVRVLQGPKAGLCCCWLDHCCMCGEKEKGRGDEQMNEVMDKETMVQRKDEMGWGCLSVCSVSNVKAERIFFFLFFFFF